MLSERTVTFWYPSVSIAEDKEKKTTAVWPRTCITRARFCIAAAKCRGPIRPMVGAMTRQADHLAIPFQLAVLA
jgi:hypothetical protein